MMAIDSAEWTGNFSPFVPNCGVVTEVTFLSRARPFVFRITKYCGYTAIPRVLFYIRIGTKIHHGNALMIYLHTWKLSFEGFVQIELVFRLIWLTIKINSEVKNTGFFGRTIPIRWKKEGPAFLDKYCCKWVVLEFARQNKMSVFEAALNMMKEAKVRKRKRTARLVFARLHAKTSSPTS